MASRRKKPTLCTKRGKRDSRHRLTKDKTQKKRNTLWIKWLWAYYCAAAKVAPKNTKSLYALCMKKASPAYKSKIYGHKLSEHDLARIARDEVDKSKWHND